MVDVIGPDFAKSIINTKGGVARINKYRVILPTMFIGGDAISMDVLCRQATLPGRAITTVPKRVNMKAVETPTGYTNTQSDMLFTETNDHSVSRYFDLWMNLIVDSETYGVAYRSEIVEDILIMSTDEAGIPTYICKLKNAFPKMKTQIDHSDMAENTVKELRVQFEFEDYEIVDFGLTGAFISDSIRNIRAQTLKIPTNILREISGG